MKRGGTGREAEGRMREVVCQQHLVTAASHGRLLRTPLLRHSLGDRGVTLVYDLMLRDDMTA